MSSRHKDVIWVDEKDNVLGEVEYNRAHEERLLHRISVVYLINEKGQILVQERADGRLDHSSAGHVDAGESYLETAKRELAEELGVADVELKELGSCTAVEPQGARHRMRIFTAHAEPGKLDPHEVADVYWANPKEVLEDMEKDTSDTKYCRGFKATLNLYLIKSS